MKTADTKHARWLNCLATFYRCFYSADAYRIVAQYWRWRFVTFSILTVFILWAAIVFRAIEDAQPFILKQAQYLIQQFPEIGIKEGVAETGHKINYHIYLPKTLNAFVTVNTNESMKHYKPTTELISVHRDGLVINGGEGKVRRVAFKKSLNLNLTHLLMHQFVLRHMNKLQHIFGLLFYFGGLPIAIIAYFLITLCLTALIQIISSLRELPIPLMPAWRMTAVLLFPALLPLTILLTINYLTAWLGVVMLAMVVIYAIFASVAYGHLDKES